VAFTGAAAAEVSLSGYAEMGIAGGDEKETQLHHDLDVTFKLSGTTDNGLEFGATIDLDEVGDDCTTGSVADDTLLPADADAEEDKVCVGGDGIGSASGEHSVFIKGGFGNLTMGDTDGAFDWALTEVAMLTAIADDHTTHAGFSGNSGLDGTYDGQIARYDYSFGDFAVAASVELDDTGAGDPVWGLGAKYSGDMGGFSLGVGVGVQSSDTKDIAGISLSAGSGGFDAVVNYSDLDGDTHAGIGLGYTTGALSVTANYGEFDSGASGWGAAANYDLGGGAVLMVGVGDSDGGDATWSAGLGLSF